MAKIYNRAKLIKKLKARRIRKLLEAAMRHQSSENWMEYLRKNPSDFGSQFYYQVKKEFNDTYPSVIELGQLSGLSYKSVLHSNLYDLADSFEELDRDEDRF